MPAGCEVNEACAVHLVWACVFMQQRRKSLNKEAKVSEDFYVCVFLPLKNSANDFK